MMIHKYVKIVSTLLRFKMFFVDVNSLKKKKKNSCTVRLTVYHIFCEGLTALRCPLNLSQKHGEEIRHPESIFAVWTVIPCLIAATLFGIM